MSVSLATTEYFKDKQGIKQESTEWHRVVFWNKTAEIVEQYCKKGSQIYVEGSLQTRKWEDKDGNRRFSTDIVARNIQFLDSRSQKDNNGEPDDLHPPHQSNADSQIPPYKPENTGRLTIDGEEEFVEDDIPFF